MLREILFAKKILEPVLRRVERGLLAGPDRDLERAIHELHALAQMVEPIYQQLQTRSNPQQSEQESVVEDTPPVVSPNTTEEPNPNTNESQGAETGEAGAA